MRVNSIMVISVSALLILTVFSMVLPVGTAQVIGTFSQNPSATAFNGNIVIEPNGTLSATAPGVATFLAQSGNTYTMTGNLNGTLTIEHNGTVLNGNGHNISYTAAVEAHVLVNMSGTNHVTMENSVLNASDSNVAIYLENASNEAITNINVFAGNILVYAANYTSGINISNSRFTGPEFASIPAPIILGAYQNPAVSTQVLPSRTSSNFTIYNDSFNRSYGNADLVLNSQNSSVIDSHFSDRGLVYSVISLSNNSVFRGNTFNDTNQIGSLLLEGISGSLLSNVTVSGNTFNTHDSDYGLRLVGNGTISDNLIYMNNASGIAAINANGGNSSISGNTIFTNISSTPFVTTTGIETGGNNNRITGNTIHIVGNTSTDEGNGILLNTYSTSVYVNNTVISGNTIYVNLTTSNTDEQANGIMVPLSLQNSTIENNRIETVGNYSYSMTAASFNNLIRNNTLTLIASQIYDGIIVNSIGSNSNHVNISGNSITVLGTITASGSNAISAGDGMAARNITIYGNSISVMSNSSNLNIISVTGTPSNITIDNNRIIETESNGMIYVYGSIQTARNVEVQSNYLQSLYPANTFGMELINVKGASVYNNTVLGANNGLFLQGASNMSFIGNSMLGTNSYEIEFQDTVANLSFYHNNFVNYSIPLAIVAASLADIQFNSSLAIGGNYWSSYTGTDANADGIGDTPFQLNMGIYDNYPLMKQWTNPVIVFIESGLPAGASWSATFNGRTVTTTSQSISFSIEDAAYQDYSYSVSSFAGYEGGGSGSFSYKGTGTTVSVAFLSYYTLNFTETGLPAGTQWSVIVNGTSHSTSGTYISVPVKGGIHTYYESESTTFYYPSVSYSNISSVDANHTIGILYTHWAYLNTSILPSNATVILNGAVDDSLAGVSYNQSVRAGSYSLVVEVKGYTTYYNNFTLGPNQTEHLTITLKVSSPNSNGISMQDYYYIGGGATVVAIAAVSAVYLRRRARP